MSFMEELAENTTVETSSAVFPGTVGMEAICNPKWVTYTLVNADEITSMAKLKDYFKKRLLWNLHQQVYGEILDELEPLLSRIRQRDYGGAAECVDRIRKATQVG